jgi:glucose/arabinose dehydrogenase
MRRLVVPVAALLMIVACGGDGGGERADPVAPTEASSNAEITSSAPADTVDTTASDPTGPETTAPATTGAAPTPGTTPPVPVGDPAITLSLVAQLEQPVAMTVRPGDSALYVAERPGRIRVIRNGQLDPTPALGITELTRAGGEQGLLGIAASPDGRFLYANYTDLRGDTQVVEFAFRADGSLDPGSRRVVLSQPQPYSNHNGGNLVFGPDGKLYIGLGDGGAAADPQRLATDPGTWLGKMLRIDPRPSGDRPYGVPADNPFVGQPDTLPEIWSTGLRNPWRYSFDRSTGDLWIADVGQNAIEEINFAPRSFGAGKGVFWGWSAFEGSARFNGDVPDTDAVGPIFEYTHAATGGCSVTGGFVYRGSRIPALQGQYVFADYCRPGIRALRLDGGRAAVLELGGDVRSIASFGEGPDGELYVLSLEGGGVWRVDPA